MDDRTKPEAQAGVADSTASSAEPPTIPDTGLAGFADAETREILNLLGDSDAGSCCGGSCCL